MQAKIEEYDRDKDNFLINAKSLFKVFFLRIIPLYSLLSGSKDR